MMITMLELEVNSQEKLDLTLYYIPFHVSGLPWLRLIRDACVGGWLRGKIWQARLRLGWSFAKKILSYIVFIIIFIDNVPPSKCIIGNRSSSHHALSNAVGPIVETVGNGTSLKWFKVWMPLKIQNCIQF